MKRVVLLLLLTGCLGQAAQTQTRFVVRLKDKAFNSFSLANPSAYLSAKAVARRQQMGIAIDSTDLPVTQRYIDSIRLSGAVTILNTSKWLNQVCIQTSDGVALTRISAFPFVVAAPAPVGAKLSGATGSNKEFDGATGNEITSPLTPQGLQDVLSYGQSYNQVHIHNGEFLHNHGFKGEGMVMAMMDAGFYRYLDLPTFDSMRLNNRVLGTWDFVANESSVNEDHPHGMQCLSTIAANLPGAFVGSAPATAFYLFRTEDAATEYPVEEQNWAAAAERADSAGAKIFSVSLGYSTFSNIIYNYTYSHMNGNTTMITRAADLAAKKGILVVVAAGNEGNKTWRFITAPADGDSVLTVGAVNTNRQVAGFSSFGPTSDGQVKPDIASVGVSTVIANTSSGQPGFGDGTSFACPNIAGLATCLWQAFPEVSNMTVVDALRQSADRFANPNDRTGYGIPDVKKAFVLLLRRLYVKQFGLNNCVSSLNWNLKTDTSFRVVIERKLASESSYSVRATIPGAGGFAAQDFRITDDFSTTPLQNISYRIRVNIAADTSFILDSVVLNHIVPCIQPVREWTKVNPNPASDLLRVEIARASPVRIAITMHNNAGQLVYRQAAQQAAGNVIYTIPVKQLGSGVYYVAVYVDDKKVLVKKVLR